jgi:hypothetical protein
MTKKNVLFASLIYVLIFIAFVFWDGWSGVGDCYDMLWCRDYFYPVLSYLLPVHVIFLFSLITYKMHDEVFFAWRNFSYWWIPLSIFLVLITPEGNSVIMSWGKEIPAVGMSVLYVLISSILIAYKFFALKKDTVGK